MNNFTQRNKIKKKKKEIFSKSTRVTASQCEQRSLLFMSIDCKICGKTKVVMQSVKNLSIIVGCYGKPSKKKHHEEKAKNVLGKLQCTKKLP